MEDIVENEELYLDPKLSLNQLAERLGTNRTYLSKYFNNVKGTTFYDYVNALRIHKKSVPLMQEHPEYAFDYIAQQSGFNSLSTFQRAFRKYTGTTPGKFIGIKCKED
jgi:AraC-like DNA-binding protein